MNESRILKLSGSCRPHKSCTNHHDHVFSSYRLTCEGEDFWLWIPFLHKGNSVHTLQILIEWEFINTQIALFWTRLWFSTTVQHWKDFQLVMPTRFRVLNPANFFNSDVFIFLVDINECLAGNGGCDQNCTNLEGKFRCSCRDGFYLYTGEGENVPEAFRNRTCLGISSIFFKNNHYYSGLTTKS